MNYPAEIIEKAKRIRCVIFDVDGVLTDRKIYYSELGIETRAFNCFDGLGMKKLMQQGIEIAIISNRNSSLVNKRMEDLGVTHFYQGVSNKREAYEKILNDLHLTDKQIAYVGDDWLDVGLIKQVGLGIVVADAEEKIVPFAAWQTRRKGGEGAAREVCDLILEAQNLFEKAYGDYLA